MLENSVVAVVPIKKNSERVPNKNFRDLGGRPLYRWLLDTLMECRTLSGILVDTDSDELLEQLSSLYPEIRGRRRPDRLAGPLTSMDEVLRELAPDVTGDIIVQLHVTNPFLRADTIDRAVKSYLDGRSDSLFSVSEIRGRLWSEDIRPLNHDPAIMERTQDMAPVYKENSCFFIFKRDAMLEKGMRVSGDVSVFPIGDLESTDIDTQDDFEFAEALAFSRLTVDGRI
ncbi:acylneuraminate cytidylyltransferase family protein [Rhodococcus sp. T2V]|uniref:acylneuraminate cytidylyltransferase family protein n=1 Tax=Rhodococcus sp. T2V TaxID=3034164 RepID=UPI0023E1364E|nr:acylneuraminate cytidylyltransferase family protein [Rhodococcus sp. T2V]MDF3303407.1 acylneuraminate cytidylyltransferase family protein [Rhodococcus sp. T2V]